MAVGWTLPKLLKDFHTSTSHSKISFSNLQVILRSLPHIMDIDSRTTIKLLHLARGGLNEILDQNET